MRAPGAQASALRCAVESRLAPAMSTCWHTPERCEARWCMEGCMGGSDEKRTGCLCVGSASESRLAFGVHRPGAAIGEHVRICFRSLDWIFVVHFS